jgi:prephenate dehydrogenase
MQPLQHERFAILGYGRFGGALAQLLQQAGYAVRVFDPAAQPPDALAAASPAAAIRDADWVVLAMPVPRMQDALRQVRPLLDARHTVIDVGSVKQQPCLWLEEMLGDAIPHLGTHPWFGPLSLARGERPLRTVVCASARHPQAAERTRALFRELGCEVIDQDPATHDRHMAHTHALAFFLAKGLIEIGVDDDLSVTPPSFQGLKNMLAAVRGDAGHLFAAIQQENPFAAEARAQLLGALQRIDRQLASADDDSLAIPERHGDA